MASVSSQLTVTNRDGQFILDLAGLIAVADSGVFTLCATCHDDIAWCPQAIRMLPALAARRAYDDDI